MEVLARPCQEAGGKKPTAHLPAIDGLRGLAAMSVVFFHCWGVSGAPQTPVAIGGWNVPLYRLVLPGYSGVYLFFVLSGFCLAYPFFANPHKPYDWLRYAASRVRRIFPPYVLSFLLLFAIGQWLAHAHIGPEKFLYEPFKLHRLVPELLLLRKSHLVASYWTLVLEWRWYFFFPFVLVLARRISPALTVGFMAGVAWLAQTPWCAAWLDAATLGPVVAFLPMFALGIWAAHIATQRPEALPAWERPLARHALRGLAASTVLCCAICPPMGTGSYLGHVVAWGPVYFFFVLAALRHPGVNAVFGSRAFVQLGAISYSVYLLQEPIIRAGGLFLGHSGTSWEFAANYLLLPLLCVAGGWAFHCVGERPFLRK